MDISDLQLSVEDWVYLGEGNAHIVCQHISTLQHISGDSSSITTAPCDQIDPNVCHSLLNAGLATVPDVAPDSPVTDSLCNESDTCSLPKHDGKFDYRNHILRISKRDLGIHDIEADLKCLNDVMKPWLGSNLTSERIIVNISSKFLTGPCGSLFELINMLLERLFTYAIS